MSLFLQEIKMNLARSFRYKFNLISDIVVFTILFSFFMLAQVGTSFSYTYHNYNHQALLLLGYIGWNFSTMCISLINNEIRHELAKGMFYHKLLSKHSLPIIYISKLISAFLIQTIVVICYTLIAVFVFQVQFTINLTIILVLIICLVGMYGIGLIVGAATLLFKKAGNIVLLLQLTLLFITDTIPTNSVILIVSRVIPLTIANDVIRTLYSSGGLNQNIFWLIFSSLIFLVIGVMSFQYALKITRKNGTMLLY